MDETSISHGLRAIHEMGLLSMVYEHGLKVGPRTFLPKAQATIIIQFRTM